jgi:hypothetical protein
MHRNGVVDAQRSVFVKTDHRQLCSRKGTIYQGARACPRKQLAARDLLQLCMVDEVAGLPYGDSRACQAAVLALGEAYNGVFASTGVHSSSRNPFKKKSTKEVLQAERDLRALKKQRVHHPHRALFLGAGESSKLNNPLLGLLSYFAPITNH